jgi:putative two-component system response regulator
LNNINENAAVAQLSEMFALSMGFSLKSAQQIKAAALLHDVGKQAVPSAILNKAGKLTPMEQTIMKSHTKMGAQMLSGMPGQFGKIARTVAEFHHERADGSGYWGIPISELPGYIPIIAVVDVFVAYRSARPYKKPWSLERSLWHLSTLEGTQFSPGTIRSFMRLIDSTRNNPGVFVLSERIAA